MLINFISITHLQRHLKNIFASKDPYRIVLGNNELKGIVIPQATAKLLLESGALEQIREELWELQDGKTVKLVRQSRVKKGPHSIPFEDFVKSL